MKRKLIADKITSEINKEERYYQVTFSGNGDDPEQYVILQKAKSFDKQDIEHGTNTYYFEYSGQAYSGYGICKKVTLNLSMIDFLIKEGSLNEITEIEILFNKDAITNWIEFEDILKTIVENDLDIVATST